MKKLLILFMPFFMVGCDTEKQPSWQALAQRDSMVSLFGQLQQRVATNDTAAIRQLGDSLGKLGQRYRWTGQADVGDSGFRDYILLNSEIESRLWDEPIKNRPLAVQFSANILPHESVLATDTALLGLWAQSLYRHTSPRAAHKYDEPVVMAFEKYLHCQNRLTGPAEKAVLAQRHFNVLQHLGIAYHILGEKKQADQYYRTALQAAVETEEAPDNTASAYINLLGFWAEYKHYDSIVKNIPVALQSIGALEADTKKKADAKRRAMFSAYYAEALYEKGNAAYALQLRQASDSLNKISAQKVDADILAKKSDILKLQGDIDFKQKRYPSAVRFYQQALNTCLQKNLANNAPPHDRSYAKLLLCLANVHDSLGQADTALRCSQFALACVTPVDSADIAQNPAPHDLYTENTILEALDAKAGLLLKKQAAQGDTALLQNAVQCFERAFAVEQKLLANFTYDDSRAELQVQTNSKERSARAIQACYQLYQLTGRPYWAEKAFLFSESSKALILLEAIKKNLNLGRYKNNPLFKQVDSLQLQLAYAEQQLLHDTNDSIAALLRKERLGNELDMALKALYASEPSYKNYRQQQDTALLANLRQKLLTPQRCLAEFFCNGNNNYLFVVRQNGALVFERLDSSLRSEVDSLMGYFTGSGPLEPPQYARVAFRLFQTCRLPTVLTAQELLLIPDGDLNRIPFDALVTDNANDGFKKLPYLFQSATTSYGYSAASLLQQPNSQVNIRQITAFAPVFKNGERGFQPLLKSETEVNSIGAQPVYLGPSATTDKLRNSFNEADIIHIATHASASSGNNANPCIEMYDGAFCLNELYAIPMRQISLVVLSACQTNQGNIDQSEGTLSLARGCYYAGAQNIVASLWKVDDASTAAIMQQFYANSGNGQYAVSLRKARQQYLREVMPGGNTAPYYWAALMHIGGFGKATDSNKDMGYGMAVLGLAILCGGAWLLWRKRRRY